MKFSWIQQTNDLKLIFFFKDFFHFVTVSVSFTSTFKLGYKEMLLILRVLSKPRHGFWLRLGFRLLFGLLLRLQLQLGLQILLGLKLVFGLLLVLGLLLLIGLVLGLWAPASWAATWTPGVDFTKSWDSSYLELGLILRSACYSAGQCKLGRVL